ncbi:MAG: hypothetical protein WBM02_05005 [bacterium]
MTSKDQQTVLLKWLGIALIIILGLLALKYVVIPFIGWLFVVLWAISGVLAYIFKIFAFIFLFIAAGIGILMLIAWIVRQFLE